MSPFDVVDRVLDRLHQTDLEYATARSEGLASHGPMVVASLAEIGRVDLVEPFVDEYVKRLRPMPSRGDAAPRLGDAETRQAWMEHYERRLLRTSDWRAVARGELRELLPGAAAGAAHGWLRTAHAYDLLSAHDTETRRRELAFAFASWAARFQQLPGTPGARPTRGLDVAAALARVPIVTVANRSTKSRILDQVKVVRDLDGFADVIEAVDLDALPLEAALSALAAECARRLLAADEGRFAYLHTITSTSALRLVAPALDEATQRSALGAIFQVVAALHATSAPAAPRAVVPAPASRDATLAKALSTLDDHDVKLTVAALREDAIRPQPDVLAAAAAWLHVA